MAIEVRLPELGENLEGGEVVDLSVRAGDLVAEGQTLLEIEAEKSTVEVPAPVAGRVAKILVGKGDKILVGQTICLIEAAISQQAGSNDGGTDGQSKDERHAIKQNSPHNGAEESNEKLAHASKETPAAVAATATLQEGGKPSSHSSSKPATLPRSGRLVPAGPATRRLARELGVDLGLVTGSARGGRVTAEDVKAFVRQLSASPRITSTGSQAPPLPDFERWGCVERRPLEPVRRKTAEQMSLAWTLIPHVTQHDQADVTDLDAFRRQQESSAPKLTITAFALKATASALKQFPQFNASLDMAAGQLILKHYYHIGVAVDTERGLLVPVLRDVDKKSVRELAQEMIAVAERARQKKLAVEEMRGGTFTITNLGGIGGTGFSPIVNYPEVAILGLSRARLLPVVRDGQIVPRLVLPLSLSYDHRVIDGADAARFAHRITQMLENPLQMLL
jgi:pyruvate dehydrogenase E2 component (dihydrolipoamide acetyltransferase)